MYITVTIPVQDMLLLHTKAGGWENVLARCRVLGRVRLVWH